MNKLKCPTFLILFVIILISITSSRAQSPTAVDVVELSINHLKNQDYISFNLITTGSDGIERRFQGRGVFDMSYSYCDWCRFPATFSTNGYNWQNSGGFSFDAGNPSNPDTPLVKFTVTESASDPIALRPTILRKKKEIDITGNTRFTGTLEIKIDNKILYYDNQVDLSGHYFTKYFQITQQQVPSSYRLADFRSINYILTKPQ